MKKLLALTLSTGMIIGLCACGNTPANTVSEEPVAETEEVVEEATVEEVTEDISEDPEVGMANPWVESTAEEIADQFLLAMNIPEEATDVVYQINNTLNMAEAMYTLDGTSFVYRVSYSEDLEDTSGIYCEWTAEEDVTVKAQVDDSYTDYEGNKGKFLGASTDECDYQVIIWYDPVLKRNLCLSATAKDLDGFDIQAFPEQTYFQPSPDSCIVEAIGDGWSTEYDVRFIYCYEDGEETVFSFYAPLVQTAGSNYASITTKKGTDYKTVLDEIKANNNDTTSEYSEGKIGESESDSYSYTVPSSDSEGSELRVIDSYTAIPHGDDVILIETFNTVEPEENAGYEVAGAFETLINSLKVE